MQSKTFKVLQLSELMWTAPQISTPHQIQLFEKACSLTLESLCQSVYFAITNNSTCIIVVIIEKTVSSVFCASVTKCSTKGVKLLKLKRWGLTDWLLTSHSPHWVAWTARGADSVAPVPRAAPDSCDAVPPLVHHLSSSASRSPPWSHAAHCEAPDTDLPTANGPAVAKHYSWMCHDLGCIIQEATASLTTWVYW